MIQRTSETSGALMSNGPQVDNFFLPRLGGTAEPLVGTINPIPIQLLADN